MYPGRTTTIACTTFTESIVRNAHLTHTYSHASVTKHVVTAGVGAILFDEFHERNLDADLSLALCLDCQALGRTDLRCGKRKPSM